MGTKRMICATLALGLAGGLLAMADIAPVLKWTVLADRLAKQDITIRKGETVVLQPTYLNNGAPINLSSAHLVTMRYRPTLAADTTWYYVITGQVASATGGVVSVRWTSAQEGTNSSYLYEIAVQSTDAMLVRSYGSILLQQGIADSIATGTIPSAVRSIDWATVEHSNIGSAPFLSDFQIDDIQEELDTLFDGIASAHVHSITSDVPYQGSARDLSDFPSYLARTNEIPVGVIINVAKGDDEAVGRVERVDEHNVSVHFPIVGEGEIQTTNRLYWVVDGQLIGYVSSNGITMLKGSLQLYEEDLNCNVRAYDGSKYAPSVTFYSSPSSGWYRKSVSGVGAWAYAHASNDVGYINNAGWTLLGTRTYVGYGTELSYCNVTAGYQHNGTNGVTTNINVIISGGATQTLRFVGGLLLP